MKMATQWNILLVKIKLLEHQNPWIVTWTQHGVTVKENQENFLKRFYTQALSNKYQRSRKITEKYA